MSAIPFIDIHTHNPVHRTGIHSIVNLRTTGAIKKIEEMIYSIGLHPWDIDPEKAGSILKELQNLALSPEIIAIGEIGLDRLINVNFSLQEEIFVQQLSLAEKLNKPVIIHCVKSFSELISLRKKSELSIPWIIHGFQKNNQIANNLIDLGCYLSFGAALLNNNTLQDHFPKLPTNRIFFETDDSDISIKEIYQKAAELMNLGIEDLKEIIVTNFNTCFKKL